MKPSNVDVMGALTNKERQQRWRDRQKGILAPAQKLSCAACGKTHTGAKGVHCSRCWEKETPEGRAYKNERVKRARAKKSTTG